MKRLLSLLLSILLFLSILPAYVKADDEQSNNEKAEETVLDQPHQKELVNERDEFSKTFEDNNGTFTREIYTEPVHRRNKGKWEEISNELISESDTLEANDTTLKASFPKKIRKNKQITYTFGNHTLEFSNISATDGEKEFTINSSSKMKNGQNKITYENAFPSIDLRHVTFNSEVKEDWIINQYNGIHQFNYTINTDLKAHLDKDGSIGFYNNTEQNEKVFELPSPMMEDSNFQQGRGNGIKSKDLHYELSQIKENQYLIQLVVDKKWLESSEREYPVYIDPSITIDNLGDTFVSSAYPTTNYNKEWDSSQGEYVLKVGKYDSTTGTNYAYIKFIMDSDLKGTIVDSADLKVYVTHAYYATTKTGLWVNYNTEHWLADELTWNNKPSSKYITSTNVARDQWANFNVKNVVQQWIDGDIPNYGFKFHTNGNGQTYWKKITAGESANKAKLVITYHYPTMKNPTVSAVQYADGKTTGYVNVSWPSVSGAKSYQLQMFDGKGFQTVYTGTATSWTSKSKKIFPLTPYSTSSTYKLDGTGTELAVDPSKFYSAKSGTSTTRKEYGFRVIANFANGNSPASAEVKKAIPASLVDTPNQPIVKANAYSESDSTNKGRGWLDISWDPVEGATGYKVLIYNGKTYDEFNVGNVTRWSTKGRKVWPTDGEISSGTYSMHTDLKGTGAELPIDPNPLYLNAIKDGGNTGYQSVRRYTVRIKAISPVGTTPSSDWNFGYIPLDSPKNVTASGEIVDFVNSKGALNLKWNAVSGAGGYIVELFDGKKYQSFDVGKVTTWNSTGKSLFEDIVNLPADPTKQYEAVGATETLINKKAYQVRVKAYRYNPETAPGSEAELSSDYRGLSAASSEELGTIPTQEDLLGLEDYFTYGTHQTGNANVSVNVTTGNLNMSMSDMSLFTRGTLGFNFTRYYNSRSNQSSVFGKGWTFTGNESLVAAPSSKNFYYFDEDGTKHEFVYDESKETFTSPKGKYFTLTKQTVGSGEGYKLTDKYGLIKIFEQDPDKKDSYRLVEYQDLNHNTIQFKYKEDQLTEITEIDSSGSTIGNSILLTYNSNGLISKASFKGRWIEYQYIDNDDSDKYESNVLDKTIVHATDTFKTLTNSFDYDENDQMTGFTDAKGNVNTFSDDDGRENTLTVLTPQKDGSESVLTTYHYDNKKNEYQVRDTEGKTTTYKRDTKNNTFAVMDTINEDGTNYTVEYDSNYNVLKSTDASGNSESNEYDDQGNLIKAVDKEGKSTGYQYNNQNLLTSQTDPTGAVTKNEYDEYGNLTKTQVGEEITEYQYDTYGRQTKEIYPNSTYTETTFTDNSILEKDAKGNTQKTIYDDYGSVTSKTDGEGRTISYEYDPLYTDLITSVTDGNGHKISYTYDKNGNMETLTDAKSHQKQYKYNGNDQVTKVELPVDGSEKMTFSYEYDPNGNMLSATKNSGIKETYTYDENDQLTNINANKGSKNFNIVNGYNENGQLTSTMLKEDNKSLVEKKFDYTNNDLLSQLKQGNYQLNYSYNDDSTIKDNQIQYNVDSQSWDVKKSFTYTEEGKPKNVDIRINDQKMFDFIYSYDLTNRQDTLDVNNSLYKQVTKLDKSNNILSIQYIKGTDSEPIDQYSYEYDQSGNIIKETTTKGDTTFSYDQNNQLIKEVLPDGTTNEYEYDEVGNRTKAITNGKTNKYTYNEANQIVSKNEDSDKYKYDSDGNLIQDENYKYEYNILGQQTKVTSLTDELIAQYEYDENGLRTKKIVGSKSYEYYFESSNLSMEIVRDKDTIIQYRYYQWGADGKPLGFIVKEQDSSGEWTNKVYYYWTNHRGDVISIRDEEGKEAGSYQYDAYGNVLDESGDISKENPIRYAGYYFDSETRNYYLKARYYNPKNGNFLVLDPHQGDENNPISQNGYTYANNNPQSMIDPNGTFAWGLVYLIPGVGEVALVGSAIILVGTGAYVSWQTGKKVKSKIKGHKSERITNVNKHNSPIWKKLKNVKGRSNRKTSGSGSKKKYYEWDNAHDDIEVYDKNGKHLGSMDPMSGEMYKPRVKGRKIKV